jgi:hypothetical protein
MDASRQPLCLAWCWAPQVFKKHQMSVEVDEGVNRA